MSVSRNEVENIAGLARLDIPPEEAEEITSQLNRILGYMDTLRKADTEGIEPTSRIARSHNTFRNDEPKSEFTREEALKNAPSSAEGYFTAPKVLGDR